MKGTKVEYKCPFLVCDHNQLVWAMTFIPRKNRKRFQLRQRNVSLFSFSFFSDSLMNPIFALAPLASLWYLRWLCSGFGLVVLLPWSSSEREDFMHSCCWQPCWLCSSSAIHGYVSFLRLWLAQSGTCVFRHLNYLFNKNWAHFQFKCLKMASALP